MKDESLRKVGKLAAARRRELQMDQAGLARTADVDPKTVRAFERGERWPRERSRTRIEAALQWSAGSLERIKAGDIPFPIRLDREFFQSQNPDPAADRVIEEALAESDRRYAERSPAVEKPLPPLSTVRPFHGGIDGLRWHMRIRQKPEHERTSEEREWIAASNAERNRLAHVAERSEAEEPLVELVDSGRILAAHKDDYDVSAYVRKVEAAVVGIMGIDRLTAALDGRATERTIIRATKAEVLDQFMDEVDRLRDAGIEGRELMRRVGSWLDAALTPNDDPPPTVDDFELVARQESDPKEDPAE
ncbi:helix-turn-helix domain-containing protein [Mycobacterium intracellulare]|uniref:helix-turn-helix domain-containing protein n=1 Tax=Mycobacterium intracellulare TaxID=1767 RepID=UPI00080B97CF|nr:hypothetical protein [Mycobacterium intracellulare]OCB15128.1 hypothetical protein A5689_27120 [Mycobacterium intracellulare subsp. yongonense]